MRALPSIFKFSAIWNILPFYGEVKQWMWLLNWLNSKTFDIWLKYKDAFIEWGYQYRSERLITLDWSDCEYLNDHYMYYKHFYLKEESLKNLVLHHLDYHNIDIITLVEVSDKIEYAFRLSIFHREKLPDYIPAVNWWKSKENLINLNMVARPEASIARLIELIKTEAVSLYKLQGVIVASIMKSPVLRFETKSGIYERKQISKFTWKDPKCWCKPVKFLTTNISNENMTNKLDALKMFSSISEMLIVNNESYFIENISIFHHIFDLIHKYKKLQIRFQNINAKFSEKKMN